MPSLLVFRQLNNNIYIVLTPPGISKKQEQPSIRVRIKPEETRVS